MRQSPSGRDHRLAPGRARCHNALVLELAGLRRRLPAFDRVIRAVGTQPITRAAMRWSTVNDPIRFNSAELFGPRGRAQLHQIGDGRVVLRHRTRDTDIFDEIFVGNLAYDPPPAVALRFRDRPPLRVLDLGANVGLFGVYALARWPDATITSVEPDPENLPLLARCIEANGATARWTVIAACAARQPGTVAFSGGRFADSAMALDGEAVTGQIVAVDAFEFLVKADFAKIDIEGAEWDLLLDPRFAVAAPDVLVMEWHQRGCPMEDAYTSVLDVLGRAGYEVAAEPPPLGQRYGTVWAWRSRRRSGSVSAA
jgi:FkbM family methyltransferase